MPRQQNENEKEVARAKDLTHKFEVIERHEAGLVLLGTEVKSLRESRASLKDSYCRFQGRELFLVGVHISMYSHGTHGNHDPERPRKLLLHKQELFRLQSKVQEKGLALVPARIYFKKGKAKVEIALAKGKKLYDRRETVKRREQDREMERAVRRGIRGDRRGAE
jgi:SsrA-binding protein